MSDDNKSWWGNLFGGNKPEGTSENSTLDPSPWKCPVCGSLDKSWLGGCKSCKRQEDIAKEADGDS